MLIHASRGNIPSKWANSIQTMKMAQAFSRRVSGYKLLIASPHSHEAANVPSLEDWYGLSTNVPIERLPLDSTPPDGVFGKVSPKGFAAKAVEYLLKTKPAKVFTRCPTIANYSARHQIPTFIESHSIIGENNYCSLAALADNPYLMGLVTITPTHREHFQRIGFASDMILVRPDAINPEEFDRSPPNEADIRRIGGDPDRPLIVYTGHLYHDRGINHLLEAAQNIPHADFLLVGGWEEDVARIRKDAKHLPNVRLTGFVVNEEIPSYLKAATILAMPYDDDVSRRGLRSSLKMFEYMAARRPIVGSDLASINSVLTHERDALLFPDKDTRSFIDCLNRLLGSKELRNKIAAGAYETVKTNTWDQRAVDILDFMENRIQADPPPRCPKYYGSKVVIFGTGTGGSQALQGLERSCDVVGFIDNSLSMTQSTFKGLPLLDPLNASKLEPDFIILASSYAAEMREQLRSLGWADDRIRMFDTTPLPSGMSVIH